MKRKINSLAAFLAVAVVTLTACTGETPAETIAELPQTTAALSAAYSSDISIPGYEALYFTAGETAQSVSFFDPDTNPCFFRLTLTADGADIWTSEYISPGETVSEIDLTKPLPKGEYPAVLHYECFSLDDKTPLNGADIELIIIVQEV